MNLFNFDAFGGGPGVAYVLAAFAIILVIIGVIISHNVLDGNQAVVNLRNFLFH